MWWLTVAPIYTQLKLLPTQNFQAANSALAFSGSMMAQMENARITAKETRVTTG